MEEAIKQRLFAQLVGQSLPIAWPNVDFIPPEDQKWLKVDYIPNRVDRLFVGSTEPHQYLGLLQVSVCWPLGAGTDDAGQVAQEIVDLFPVDLKLGTTDPIVRIYERSSVAAVIIGETSIFIPVRVKWETYA